MFVGNPERDPYRRETPYSGVQLEFRQEALAIVSRRL